MYVRDNVSVQGCSKGALAADMKLEAGMQRMQGSQLCEVWLFFSPFVALTGVITCIQGYREGAVDAEDEAWGREVGNARWQPGQQGC